MYSNMFSIRRATLIAFMMLGLTSLSLMTSCNKEQAKPELSEQQKFNRKNVPINYKQPCTPEEIQRLNQGFGCFIQNVNTGTQICGVYNCCTNCHRVVFLVCKFCIVI